jgi:PAS domain S-box-containing protein
VTDQDLSRATPASIIPILVVDDSPGKRLAMQAALAPLGHEVVEADGGEAALRTLLTKDFAVILMDVRMPTMSGYEVADLIRQRDRSSVTPIIFVTSHSGDEVDVAEGYAKGAVDFIVAPIDPAILRAKVEVFVDLYATSQRLRIALHDATTLSEERAQLAAIVEASTDAIINSDSDGVITSWNQGATQMYGYGAAEMIGSPRASLTATTDGLVMGSLAPDGAVASDSAHDVHHVTKAGRHLNLSVSYTPIVDGRGTAVGVSSTSRDVGEIVDLNTSLALHAGRQSQVLELFQMALAGAGLPALMERAAHTLAETTSSPVAHVLQVDLLEREFSVAGSWGEAPEWGSPFWEPSLNLGWQAAACDAPVTAADYAGGEAESASASALAGPALGSGIAILLGTLEAPWGVAAVHDIVPRQFSTGDLEFLQLVGHLLSLAIARERAAHERERLLAQVVSAREEERNSIAADIHDDAVQVMTVAGMRMFMLAEKLQDPDVRATAEALKGSISFAIDRLRSLMFRLIPPDLARVGLEAALRDQVDHLSEELAIPCTLTSSLALEPDSRTGIALYRVFQEAASNIRKHSHAAHVGVTLSQEGQTLVMRVTDDGLGFLPGAPVAPGHFGMSSMRGRIEAEDGTWAVTSAPGDGTVVEASLPLPA